jgi:hypothetical protein
MAPQKKGGMPMDAAGTSQASGTHNCGLRGRLEPVDASKP